MHSQDSIMSTPAIPLPTKVTEKLNRYVPRDATIFYNEKLGWVYERRSSDARPEADVGKVDRKTLEPDENQSPMEHLGPFGTCQADISLSKKDGSTDMYRIKTTAKLKHLREVLETRITGQHAPIAPVTLEVGARDMAKIPHGATHFCWVYPPTGFTQLTEEQKVSINDLVNTGDPEYTFVALGGFAYFYIDHETCEVLQTNALVKSDNGLVFEGPHPWRSEYTENLQRQGRFQDVTIGELLELGVKKYCFINPNERLKSSKRNGIDWQPARNGAFVYLYDERLRPQRFDCYFPVADRPSSNQISTRIQPFSLIRNRPRTSLPSANQETDRFTCLLCRDQPIRCLFLPCKHMCTCPPCAERTRVELGSKCPICRQTFTETWDVFV